ncbi:hypothetical protein CFU_0543 [Collimonas fungivorans Ter331]|uniref:Uncharacterized protein n=1 Tax=Collimonas fungivorans (strain Ter331) TaxID=1005048 RepID=G0AHV1_COLFT|nr:hypothetical protein CFU_0543 [Collimonas fungivorans Ter331]
MSLKIIAAGDDTDHGGNVSPSFLQKVSLIDPEN